MRKHVFSIIFTAVTILAGCHRAPVEEEVPEPEMPRLGFFSDGLDLVKGEVKAGDTFTALMMRLGASAEQAQALSQACDTVFDVRRLRAGNSYTAYHAGDRLSHNLSFVVYDNDKIHQTVFKCTDTVGVWVSEKEVTHELKYSDFTIHSSLWNDMRAAGASPLLILDLSDIYAWTVDFFGLQEEDRFRLMYSQSICEDELIAIDTIYYAVFTREDKDVYAIMYDQGDKGNRYWNEKGESLRKAFLKAPLQFSRISSGFSYHRRHPVSGKVKPHTAIDYAAPTGTPVMSIGDGTVLSVGWAGGGGNTVKIRHNAQYVTSYMHLSKYAKGIKAGSHVSQGQVIGYVGATGTATGPHLDFRVYKNGTAINPLKMESPSEDPIRPENKSALDSVHIVYKAMIDSLAALQ
ncbi:MAG: peptidoglycan DD-metalloendopeptidase family protein [Bacteroidales bacterium]|nr:peptidoglycan DD-metalloendopeptidase family protein [Bacteroidales bacterium]